MEKIMGKHEKYLMVRAYKEAIENIRKKGREPSQETLDRYKRLRESLTFGLNGKLKWITLT